MQTHHAFAPFLLAALASAQNAYLVDSDLDQLFSVDLSTGAATLIASTANNGLGTPADATFDDAGVLWTIDLAGGEVGPIDTTTGVFTPVFQTGQGGWQGMAWDPVGQVFYLANQTNPDLYVLDPVSGTTTLVGDTGVSLITALACDAGGNLWGIDFFSPSALVLIDKTTAAATPIGNSVVGIQGLSFDAAGVLYGANTNDDSLYRIDIATAAGVLVGANGAGVTFAKGFAIERAVGTPATNTPYGSGCGGLTLSGMTRPITGTNWDLALTGTPAGTVVGVLALGTTGLNVPLASLGAPGCSLYTSPDFLGTLFLPIPTPAFTLAIPASASFVGISVFGQGGALAPGFNALGLATSNGLEGTIGDV